MPELSIDLESTVNSKDNNFALVGKEFFNADKMSILSWNRIFNFFRANRAENAVNFYSFATCSINIDKSKSDTLEFISPFIEKITECHPGNKISSSVSISFIGKNNNEIKDDAQLEFKKNFEEFNPYPAPKNFPSTDSLIAPKFFYSVDNFFLQAHGSSLWKIYGVFPDEEYTLNPGDVIFIPKKLVHSAEYISPGSILSVSFSD